MEHTKELLSVPRSLVPSRVNVRRHSVGQVEELAALIEAQGLLRNLVVTEQEVGRGKSRKLRFAVAAGERRRRALLLLLQQRGRLPKGHEVLCELVPPERALEVSLAENSGREAMHPADEFEAFKALIDEGKGVEDVAARFGVPAISWFASSASTPTRPRAVSCGATCSTTRRPVSCRIQRCWRGWRSRSWRRWPAPCGRLEVGRGAVERGIAGAVAVCALWARQPQAHGRRTGGTRCPCAARCRTAAAGAGAR